MTTTDITNSEGYRRLLQAVERDEQGPSNNMHNYRAKLAWVLARAQHYGDVTGLDPAEILNAWEKQRNYWYMNYYQPSNQPELGTQRAIVFETQEALQEAIGKGGFRCPMCGGVSPNPYECESGKEMEPGKPCNWKVYGLFRDMGKGVFVFCKDRMRGNLIFKPLAWEEASPAPAAL